MSLIHEALKKAEQQRRLGEPPSLGTPFARAPQRRPLLPFLAVAIVGVLGAGWYLSQSGSPDEPAAAPKAEKPAVAANDTNGRNTPTASAMTPGAPASGADQRRPTAGPNPPPNADVASMPPAMPRLGNQATAPTNPPTVKEVAERESQPHPPGANPLAPGEAAPLTLGAPPPETAMNDPEGLAAKQAAKEREFAANAANSGEPGRSPFI
jgi:general secretion pathway protein B